MRQLSVEKIRDGVSERKANGSQRRIAGEDSRLQTPKEGWSSGREVGEGVQSGNWRGRKFRGFWSRCGLAPLGSPKASSNDNIIYSTQIYEENCVCEECFFSLLISLLIDSSFFKNCR